MGTGGVLETIKKTMQVNEIDLKKKKKTNKYFIN